MKSHLKYVITTCFAFVFYVVGQAQSLYSDLTITSMSLSAAGPQKKVAAVTKSINQPNQKPVNIEISNDILKCTITVDNISTANAYGAKLIVMIPTEAALPSGSLPSNATVVSQRVSTGWGPGYIEFDLTIVYPGRPVTVEFTFVRSTHGNKLSAYVMCGVPDLNPQNNYKEASY